MDKIYYSDVHFKKDKLHLKKYLENKYQAVIAPCRGGLTMGTKLSHILDIPLGIIDYQRLDSTMMRPSIKFAIEPVAKDKDHEELPFVFMDKILLVDDICDTGKSIEKIYKFLKLVNSNVEIDILCIYGNKGAEEYLGKYLPEAKLNYLYDNEDRWVTFGTWENDYNICKACIFGEACNRDPENMIHCSLHDKSFQWTHSCADFSLIKTHDIKFMGAGTLG